MPGGQTGLIPSIEEIPRPPSEQGTSSLPGLATDNIGYQTASSGSDEAATGLLERYSGGHTQDHTVEYTHNTSLKPRQPPASPPGAPTAVARGLTMVHLRGRSPTKPLSRGRSLSPSVLSPKLRMEQPAPALRNMGRIRSLREPSLSPNQQTGSYGSPSPSLGSEIDYPHATFRPRLADLWSDDPTPPPHVAVTAADAGSATGARQSGPVSSASAEGRQAILSNPVFVRMSDQQNSSRPTGADFSSPFGPSGHRLLNCHRRMIFSQLCMMLLLRMLLCARLAPPLRLAAPLLRNPQRVARRRPPMLLTTPPSVRLYTHHCADANGSVAGPTESTARVAAVIVAFQRSPLARIN